MKKVLVLSNITLLNEVMSFHPQNFLIDMASYVLKYNFSFDKDFYLQVSAPAMGSIFAPNYANLLMGYFDHCYVFNSEVNPFVHILLDGTDTMMTNFAFFMGDLNGLAVCIYSK